MINEIIQKYKISGISKLNYNPDFLFINETPDMVFIKDSGKFRYSYDNMLYTDWKELSTLPEKTFNNKKESLYIQFKFELENNTDPYKNINELIPEERPNFDLGLTDESEEEIAETCKLPNLYDGPESVCEASLVYCDSDSNANLFNPYNTGSMSSIYTELSNVISNTFGHAVRYFKTELNKNTKDYILKEYSLHNVINAADIKVLIPDNAFPTNDFEVNTLMINYPQTFEVHITKDQFRQAFGQDAIPLEHDYLWFQVAQFNRVFEVNSVRNPDLFITESSYWRVLLTPYQKRAAVEYPETELGQTLLDETNELIINKEKKEIEVKEVIRDFKEHRDKEQLTDPEYNFRTRGDLIRPGRGSGIKTVETQVFHRSVPVIRSYYDFSSAMPFDSGNPDDNPIITYCYTRPLDFKEYEYTLIFWIKPERLIQTPTKLMKVSCLDIDLCTRSIGINGQTFQFGGTLAKGNWYMFVVSMNDGIGAYWCYELATPKKGPVSVKNKYLTLFGMEDGGAGAKAEFEFDTESGNNGQYSLYKNGYYITNIRLFNLMIDPSRHISTGCQHMVQESANLLFADNADNQLQNIEHPARPNEQ